MWHFGVDLVMKEDGMKLTRGNYAVISNKNSFVSSIWSPGIGMGSGANPEKYADPEGKFYTDKWCKKHREACLENFDLNMDFFSKLNHDEFDEEVNRFLKRHKNFKKVENLNEYRDAGGYYMMVLDEYCQIYIGTTQNIKVRVMQHWSKRHPFDRLLLGTVETSTISINSFRALDTTRIFAYETLTLFTEEDDFISEFSPKFVTNRIGGGKLEAGPLGVLQAAATIKTRDFE